MRKFFVNSNQINNNKIEILNDDVNHIKNVLRLENGEKIKICDSDNLKNYICEIESITNKNVICNILEEVTGKAEGNVELHILVRDDGSSDNTEEIVTWLDPVSLQITKTFGRFNRISLP